MIISHRSSAIATTTRLLVLRDGLAQAFGPTPQVLADLARASRPAGKPVVAAAPVGNSPPDAIAA